MSLISRNKELKKTGKKLCSLCNKELPISEFAVKSSRCKVCYREWYRKDRKNNPERYKQMTNKYRQSKGIVARLITRLSSYRRAAEKENVPFDLTTDFLFDLWQIQDGKCYYSDSNLIIFPTNGKVERLSASLDRLIPEKGYTQGNVVWCAYWINTAKGILSEHNFYKEIRNILDRME